jgi:ferritin
MEIKRVNISNPNWDAGAGKTIAENVAVVLDLNKRKVTVKRKNIRDVAKGLAEIAYSMGDTNDIDFLSEWIAEDIEEGLSLAEKRRRKKARQ